MIDRVVILMVSYPLEGLIVSLYILALLLSIKEIHILMTLYADWRAEDTYMKMEQQYYSTEKMESGD